MLVRYYLQMAGKKFILNKGDEEEGRIITWVNDCPHWPHRIPSSWCV
jgi:hypothetical protein